MAGFTEALRVIGEALGIVNKRMEQKNAPDVRQRAKAQSEVEQQEATANAVERKDTDEIRRQLAD